MVNGWKKSFFWLGVELAFDQNFKCSRPWADFFTLNRRFGICDFAPPIHAYCVNDRQPSIWSVSADWTEQAIFAWLLIRQRSKTEANTAARHRRQTVAWSNVSLVCHELAPMASTHCRRCSTHCHHGVKIICVQISLSPFSHRHVALPSPCPNNLCLLWVLSIK